MLDQLFPLISCLLLEGGEGVTEDGGGMRACDLAHGDLGALLIRVQAVDESTLMLACTAALPARARVVVGLAAKQPFHFATQGKCVAFRSTFFARPH